jgi:hypothetical protein
MTRGQQRYHSELHQALAEKFGIHGVGVSSNGARYEFDVGNSPGDSDTVVIFEPENGDVAYFERGSSDSFNQVAEVLDGDVEQRKGDHVLEY